MSSRIISSAHKHVPRIHSACTLVKDSTIPLTSAQANHVLNVLRLQPGSELRVYNAADGEYTAQLRHTGRASSAKAVLETRVRAPLHVAAVDATDAGAGGSGNRQVASHGGVSAGGRGRLHGPLLMAPVLKNRDALQFMIEKAVECGASGFLPLLCDRAHRSSYGPTGREKEGQGEGEEKEEEGRVDAYDKTTQDLYVSSLSSCGLHGSPLPKPLDGMRGMRAWAWAVGASEQCGRLDVPPVLPRALALGDAMAWFMGDKSGILGAKRVLLVCDGGAAALPIHQQLTSLLADVRLDKGLGLGLGGGGVQAQDLHLGVSVGIAVGPEGGWSAEEIHSIQSIVDNPRPTLVTAQGTPTPPHPDPQAQGQARVAWVGLGPRTLRAETAALAALVQVTSTLRV